MLVWVQSHFCRMPSDYEERFLDRAIDLARDLFPNQPNGFPLGDFDFSDIQLPADNDFGVPSEDDNTDEEELNEETGFGSVIGEFIDIQSRNSMYHQLT